MSPRRLFPAALVLMSSAIAACTDVQSRHQHLPGQAPGPVAAGSTRQVLFNEGWLFTKGDAADAQKPAIDTRTWRTLNLPHDWSIEGPFDPTLGAATAYLPGGVGWYRKSFKTPANVANHNVTIRFDGVYKNSSVYLNGQKLGTRPYGYSSFEYDVTPYLLPVGQDNVLAVRVDHTDHNDSRWYPGSGIYRNVWLTVTGSTRVDRWGTFVTTPQVTASAATVQIQIGIRNDSNASVPTQVTTRLLGPDGRQVAWLTTESQTIAPSANETVRQQLTVPTPVLWSVDQPALYTAITEIRQNNQLLDSYKTPFGIRTFKFDPNTGFSLNGVSMKLKGVCLHHDAGGLGAAVPQQVWERRLRILKSAGTNAIRCSHNPPAPEFLDLCDRLGFLVMNEAFDEWSKGKKKWYDNWNGKKFTTDGYHSVFNEWADRDLQDMVLRDRNHPSIILWSIGNEIDYPNDPYPENSTEPRDIATRLIARVKELDTSRPVTAACASIPTNLFYQQLDVIGYNYQERRYPEDRARMPDRVIYGSENGHTLDAWLAVANNPAIPAQFLWTGIDYLGEASSPGEANAWPNRSNRSGILDTAAYPKPMYWFRRSLWNDQPLVKIDLPLPVRRGGTQPAAASRPTLACYTNCDTVELFQNGQSLGEQPLPPSRIIPITANPAQGPLRAVGKKAGKVVAEDTFVAVGQAARIDLQEYKTTIPHDGPNVAQVELSLTDANGNLAREATNSVAVEVRGHGRLLTLDSGDPNSVENYRVPTRKAFGGRLLLYVETRGPAQVTATAEGLPPATVTVGR